MTNSCNLILAFRPEAFSPTDYLAIAEEIRKIAPDIDIFIVADQRGVVVPAAAKLRPLLTFSPSPLTHFRPPRGSVASGQRMPKSEQKRQLAKGGVRVPKWCVITSNIRLSEGEWGPYVIVKPDAYGAASKGRGISLVSTKCVTYVPQLFFAKDHPGFYGDMLAQKFIDTGDYSEDYRVVTLFGRPLYALRRKSLVKLVRPDGKDILKVTAGVVSNSTSGPREMGLCNERDILDFASRCYAAVPSVPFQAIDVRRESGTGKLYCLEINPGGNTWNFSSARSNQIPEIDGIRREDQFGAWKIAAEALVEATRLRAS